MKKIKNYEMKNKKKKYYYNVPYKGLKEINIIQYFKGKAEITFKDEKIKSKGFWIYANNIIEKEIEENKIYPNEYSK